VSKTVQIHPAPAKTRRPAGIVVRPGLVTCRSAPACADQSNAKTRGADVRKKLTHTLAALATAATVILAPGTAQAIGDNNSCTWLYGSGSTKARACGNYWSVGGGNYDGSFTVTSNNGYMQHQVNGGPWYDIRYKGWTGGGDFSGLRTYYIRVCAGSGGSGCSGKW
jgi:hypothetical protein